MDIFEKARHRNSEVIEEKPVLFDVYEKEHPDLFKDLFTEVVGLIPDKGAINKKQGNLKIGDYVEHEESFLDDKKHFGVFICGVSPRDVAADCDSPEIYARGDADDSVLIMVHGNRSKGYHYVSDDRMLVKFQLKDFTKIEWNYSTYGVEQPIFDNKGDFYGIEVDQERLAIEEGKVLADDNIMRRMVNAIRKLPYKNIDEYVESREKGKIGKTALKK